MTGLLCIVAFSKAQTAQISGRILDSLTRAPMSLVTVSLFNQKKSLIQSMISDSAGSYAFSAVKPGEYSLRFTMTGFRGFVTPAFSVRDSAKILLPDYFLSTFYKELSEVIVSTERSLVSPKIDGFLYNARNDIPVAGETASDVLRKLPGVMVSPDGVPSMRGSSRIKVFIDGKPSEVYAASIADALRQVSSENIASMEIITHPSAKYEGEGVDGVIKIETIRPLQNGTSGNINAMVAPRNSNINANLLMRRKNWIISTDVGHYNLNINVLSITNRNGLGSLSDIRLHQERFSEVNRNNEYGGLRFIYLADSLTSYHLGYRATWYHDNFHHTNDYSLQTGSSTDAFTRITENPILRWAHNLTGGYSRKSRDKKADFHLLLLGTQNPFTNRYFLREEKTNIETYREENNNEMLVREVVIQADYSREFKNANFETGLRFSYKKLNNENNFDVLDYRTGKFNRDHQRSSTFGQRIAVSALYGSYGFNLGKYKLRTGIRYENTYLALTANNTGITTPAYNNLLPNLLVSRTFNKTHTITAAYSKRIQRPYTVYLNPVVNYMDSLNIEYGNPNLKPVIIHNYSLSYVYQKRNVLIDGSLFATRSANNIEYVRMIKTSGVTESSWFNISSNTVYGATFNLSWQGKRFSFRLNNTLRSVYFNSNGAFPEKRGLMFSNGGYFSYKFKNGYTLTSFTSLNSRSINLQGFSSATYWYNIILSKNYKNGKINAAIRLDNFFTPYQFITEETANELFFQQTKTRNIYRFFKFNLSYKIGKKEVRVPATKQISGDN